MREMMNTLRDGLVVFYRNVFDQPDATFSPDMLFPWFWFAIVAYSCLARQPFIQLRAYEESKRRQNDSDRTTKKKRILDRLAAGYVTRDGVLEVHDQESLVSVGDVRGPELLTHLIPKTEQETPETLTVTVQFSVKISDSGIEKFKESLKQLYVDDEGDAAIRWLQRGRTVQAKVELRDSILHELENIFKVASDLDKGCTLQVESWGILKGAGVWQTNVLDLEEMPVMYHSEYAAGILTLTGKNLKGVKIMLAHDHDSIKLGGQQKVQVQEFRYRRWGDTDAHKEYLKLPVRLSVQEIDDVRVYATKNTKLDGQSVVIFSRAIQVKDSLWKTGSLSNYLPLYSCRTSYKLPVVNIRNNVDFEVYPSVVMEAQSSVFVRWIIQNLLLVFMSIPLISILRFLFTWIIHNVGLLGNAFLFIALIPTLLFRSFFVRLEDFRNVCHGFVRVVWTLYFGAVDYIRREPHLPNSTGREGSPRSLSPTGSAHTAVCGSAASPVSSATSPVANSTSRQQKVENTRKNRLTEAWEPCIIENVGVSTSRQAKKDVDDVDGDINPFVVIYRKTERRPWAEEVMIQIASEHLIKVLQKHLPSHGHILCTERPQIPGGDILPVVDSLSVEGAGIQQHQLSKAQLHLDLLVRYIRKEYRDVLVRLERMKQERLVSYDLLGALFYPGQKVAYKCLHTETLLCATIAKRPVYYLEECVKLRLDVYDFNGRAYKRCNILREITKFHGELLLESLPVCPIDMMSKPQEVLEAEFVAHGRRYYDLAIAQSYRYMSYQGAIFCLQRRSRLAHSFCSPNAKENADGRVMIDTVRFLGMNSGLRTYSVGHQRTHLSVAPDQFENYTSLAIPEDLSDEKLMFAPGVVMGFCFALKQWGLFSVSGFSDIVFDANAFSELVLEPEDKSLIYSVVSQYVAEPHKQLDRIDPISKKGDGCIILCHGPSGTGKTLTAESVAENLRRPLWALNLSQLGNDSEEFESSLSTVLNIASFWHAIVLLDDADIFLENRTNANVLGRNAMIRVLLRQLEYYRGIMFLTTNRVSAFDEAVRSRVSLLVSYPQLGVTQRGQVWRSLLSRAGVHDNSIPDEFSAIDFNGREIRNIIHTALLWAKSKNETLGIDHVKCVLKVSTRSVKTLEDAVDDSFVV